MESKYKYSSLEDFLNSNRLDVDGVLDDGWGAKFAVKGREVYAAILFCDISSFSRRSYNLAPIETLILVNNFFAWISAEALKDCPGIVDKYIGDEIMVVFSKEFGSADPVADAIQTARFMAEKDALNFCPHMGIAAGNVVVGYVGTALKYNCSVFGRPVAIASRCASVKPGKGLSATIVFPAELWGDRKYAEIFPPIKYIYPDGKIQVMPPSWTMSPSRVISMKNMPDIEIIEIISECFWRPSESIEDITRSNFKCLKEEGSYHLMRYPHEVDEEQKHDIIK